MENEYNQSLWRYGFGLLQVINGFPFSDMFARKDVYFLFF